MSEEQQIDVEHVNRLLQKFQQRIGELVSNNIALETEIERLANIISQLRRDEDTTKSAMEPPSEYYEKAESSLFE
jgi:regulator of replication initiation timing